MTFHTLRSAKYINLETFKRSGEGVKTPVWQVSDGENLYIWTSPNSWKVKRVRNNPNVRFCACDRRGTDEQREWFDGSATRVTEPGTLTRIEKLMGKKYGLLFYLYYLPRCITRKRGAVLEISPTLSQQPNP